MRWTSWACKQGDRVATLGWNTATHLELYFGVPCMGAVLHTLNLRLFPQDCRLHHQRRAGWPDLRGRRSAAAAGDASATSLAPVRNLIVMNGTGEPDRRLEAAADPRLRGIAGRRAETTTYPWPELDERQAAAMCYTSGTTGNPKGVVYSHRSIVLHSSALTQTDVGGLSERDRVMPFVPMFHANAWGLAHAAPMVGASWSSPGG